MEKVKFSHPEVNKGYQKSWTSIRKFTHKGNAGFFSQSGQMTVRVMRNLADYQVFLSSVEPLNN